MTGKLNALGLAILATFAVGGIAASAASAHTPATFVSGSDNTIVTGSGALLMEKVDWQGVGYPLFTCSGGSLEGHLGTAESTITLNPEYASCTVHLTSTFTGKTKVDMNGCQYQISAEEALNGERGAVHIVCPEGKSIQITAEVVLTGQFVKCFDIPAQTPTVPTLDFENRQYEVGGKKYSEVKMTSTIGGLTYQRTGSCGEGTFDDFAFTSEAFMVGEDEEGNPVDVRWEPTVP